MSVSRALLVVALVSGSLAGILYHASIQRVSVAVAARDLPAGTRLAPADIAVADLPPDAVPPSAIRDPAGAEGLVTLGGLLRGQLVLGPGLGEESASFALRARLAARSRVIALPVAVSNALGGAIGPGARVDVIAVPIAGQAPPDRIAELIGRAVLVLDVRTENGARSLDQAESRTDPIRERIGSVLVEIPALLETLFADRIATSTIVLVYVPRDAW